MREINPKTATRRAVKGFIPKDAIWGYSMFTPKGYISCRGTFEDGFGEKFLRLPCQKGDILYVRETWAFQCCIECMNIYEDDSCMIGKTSTTHEDKDAISEGCYIYRADHPHAERITWRPSIHMPKEAARIWLKVTDVRVERLQEITEGQAVKEGITCVKYDADTGKEMSASLDWFPVLWNSTLKKSDLDRYGWDANPWVWVIEFEQCEKPKDWGGNK